MKRVTLRVPEEQVEALEEQVDRGRFPNRSEAVRTAIRELLEDDGPTKYSTHRAHQERDPRNLRTDGGLSISFEELEKRKYQRSSTPENERGRCPECGAYSIRPFSGRHGTNTADFRCDRCGEFFNEPVRIEDAPTSDFSSDGSQQGGHNG